MHPEPARSQDDPLVALFAAPPRTAPRKLLRVVRRQAAPTWLIGFGLVFVLGGILGMAKFFPWHWLAERRLAAADTARATGRIIAMEKTSISMGDRRILRFAFEFTPPGGGAVVRSECFVLAQSSGGQTWNPALRRSWMAGDTVPVRYRPEEAALACLAIQGVHLDPCGPVGAVLLILPAIGFGVLGVVGLVRHRAVRLLTYGVLTEGRVTAVTRVGLGGKYNQSAVFNITLRLMDDPDLPPTKIQRRHPAIVALAHERLASGQPIFILYDPEQPRRVLLPEALVS